MNTPPPALHDQDPRHPLSRLTRRQWLGGSLLGGAGLALASLGWAPRSRAAVPGARVVVVGAGMAGATAAKYLRHWGGPDLAVTLVEPDAAYTSNIMSNLVLSGGRSLDSLRQDTGALNSVHGVVRRQAWVRSLDTALKQVHLSDGGVLPYDRLVLAPGVSFMDAYGLTASDFDTRTPHAWRAGPQTQLLRDQLLAMPADGQVVMTIPKAPYRCPPGPYERACLIADFLKTQKGPAARLLVLDENPGIQAEPATFNQAFQVIHAGVIDYQSGCSELQVNPQTRRVQWVDALGQGRSIDAQVVNPIVPHRAAGSEPGGWLAEAGLANGSEGRWAQVEVRSFESTAVPGVHVIGDAAQCGLPKAGHVANQEAKLCADAILRLLAGQAPMASPVANSACFSPITASTASWLTAVYQYDATTHSWRAAADNGNLSTGRAIESASISSRNFQQMNTWFRTLMADSFS